MTKRKHKLSLRQRGWLVLCLSLVLTLALAIPSFSWTQRSVKTMASRHNSKLSPVVMIPGSSATVDRFDELVKEINQGAPQAHSVIKMKIYNSGKIVTTGKLLKNDVEPFIVVGFENNKDGYANIKKQGKMFSAAFTQMSKRFNFNNFKGIGHSNGGLVFTEFLENYFDNDEITMKKLMTLGTPYNFAESSIDRKTQMLADLIAGRKNIPTDLTVYSVSGTENYDSDGIVPVESVTAGKYIFQNQVSHYTQVTVTGKMAQHSELVQNKEIVQLIEKDILNSEQQKQKKKTNGDVDELNQFISDDTQK